MSTIQKRNLFVTGFFGWNNIKWFIMELGKLGSDEKSYFSKKRITEFVGFAILEYGCLEWLFVLINAPVKSTAEFIMWAGVNLTICGYALAQIQKEKREKNKLQQTESEI